MKFSVVAVYYRLLKEIVFFLFIFIIDRSNNFEGSKTKNRRIFEKKKKKLPFESKKRRKIASKFLKKISNIHLQPQPLNLLLVEPVPLRFERKGLNRVWHEQGPGIVSMIKGSVPWRNEIRAISRPIKWNIFVTRVEGALISFRRRTRGGVEGERGRRKKLIRAGRIN